MGYWKAITGEGEQGRVVRKFGFRGQNKRGNRLLEFWQEEKLFVANTWFKNIMRRRYI